MARFFFGGAGLLLVLTTSTVVMAQETWPTYPLDGDNITRGPGFYFAWWKLLLFWILFLLWVRTTDWVNRDSQILNLNHNLWNPVNFFPFLFAFLVLGLTLPFAAGFAILMLAWLVPLGVYIYTRNSNVVDYEKVLTPDHMRLHAVRPTKRGSA